MKKIVLSILFIALMGSAAFANDSTIGNLNSGGALQPTDAIPIVRSGQNLKAFMASPTPISGGGSGSTTPSGALDNYVGVSGSMAGAIVRLSSGSYGLASSVCGLFTDATTCAHILGYADPRQFGAVCGANFSVNNNTDDDAPGIQAALNTGVPVMIPYPGCKIASQIKMTAVGQTLFSFGNGSTYNSNVPGNPYIFIPNDIAPGSHPSAPSQDGSTNNCAIDTKGFDNININNLTFRGNYADVGTVAMCNSVGVHSGLSAGFLNLTNVTFANLGNGVGGAMFGYFDNGGVATTCQPTGTLQNVVFQVRFNKVNFIGNCAGVYGNVSDVHGTDMFFADDQIGFSTVPGFAGAIDLNNIRVEYGLNFASGNVLPNDGAGIFIDSPIGGNISNLTCDHVYGACWRTGVHARHVNFNNVIAFDSDYGGSLVTDKCHFVIDGSSGVTATNITASKNVISTPYTLCIKNNADYVTWSDPIGITGAGSFVGGGWTTAYLNAVTTPAHSDISIGGIEKILFGTPIGLGTLTPNAGSVIDASATTGSIALPSGTTGQRPSSPIVGQIRYSSSLNSVEVYSGSSPAWTALGSGGATVPSVRIIASGTTDTATTADAQNEIAWNSVSTGAKAQGIPGCSTTANGYNVTDEVGTANLYPIVITPTSGTVNGLLSISINLKNGRLHLKCDGVSNYMAN